MSSAFWNAKRIRGTNNRLEVEESIVDYEYDVAAISCLFLSKTQQILWTIHVHDVCFMWICLRFEQYRLPFCTSIRLWRLSFLLWSRQWITGQSKSNEASSKHQRFLNLLLFCYVMKHYIMQYKSAAFSCNIIQVLNIYALFYHNRFIHHFPGLVLIGLVTLYGWFLTLITHAYHGYRDFHSRLCSVQTMFRDLERPLYQNWGRH